MQLQTRADQRPAVIDDLAFVELRDRGAGEGGQRVSGRVGNEMYIQLISPPGAVDSVNKMAARPPPEGSTCITASFSDRLIVFMRSAAML
jgi:hypothetical protein